MPLDFDKPRAEPTLGRMDRRLRPERDLFPRTEIIYGLREVGGYWTTPDPQQAHQIKRYSEEIARKEREQGNPIHQPVIYRTGETFKVFDSTDTSSSATYTSITTNTTNNTERWTYGNIPYGAQDQLRYCLHHRMAFDLPLTDGDRIEGFWDPSMFSFEITFHSGREPAHYRHRISAEELMDKADPLFTLDYVIDQARRSIEEKRGKYRLDNLAYPELSAYLKP